MVWNSDLEYIYEEFSRDIHGLLILSGPCDSLAKRGFKMKIFSSSEIIQNSLPLIMIQMVWIVFFCMPLFTLLLFYAGITLLISDCNCPNYLNLLPKGCLCKTLCFTFLILTSIAIQIKCTVSSYIYVHYYYRFELK